ncbi:MAG: SDR family oxidoreductase [Gemmatimonas sp.]
MKVFVTGASGWVGSVVVRELVQRGHEVTGLIRSAARASIVEQAGGAPLLGTLDDHALLRDAALRADAVIHTAFSHDDFSKFADNAEQDRKAIEAMGSAMLGSDRMLIVTSGVAGLVKGGVATEHDFPPPTNIHPRKSEIAARALAEQGLRVSTVRLPPSVHGVGDHGFVPMLAALARQTGVSAYIGEGENRWCATHRFDAGKVYALTLEDGLSMSAYHAIAEEGVQFRDLATIIGKQLGLPVESRDREHFGWFAGFAGMDAPASSDITRARLSWTPTEPGILADLDQAAYFDQ